MEIEKKYSLAGTTEIRKTFPFLHSPTPPQKKMWVYTFKDYWQIIRIAFQFLQKLPSFQ